jgi:hypothetical protein
MEDMNPAGLKRLHAPDDWIRPYVNTMNDGRRPVVPDDISMTEPQHFNNNDNDDDYNIIQ